MELKELKEKYKDIVILIIEQAGEDTNNNIYINCGKILNTDEMVNSFMNNNESNFEVFIVACIITILKNIHGLDKLENLSNNSESEIDYLIDDMWERYLKKPTRKFISKYGLKPIDDLQYSVRVWNLNNKK